MYARTPESAWTNHGLQAEPAGGGGVGWRVGGGGVGWCVGWLVFVGVLVGGGGGGGAAVSVFFLLRTFAGGGGGAAVSVFFLLRPVVESSSESASRTASLSLLDSKT